MPTKDRAPRNRTIDLSEEERTLYQSRLVRLHAPATPLELVDRTVCQNILSVLPFLPPQFVDLLFVDPPYNLARQYSERQFNRMRREDYAEWIEQWLSKLVRTLKPSASVYICTDWRSLAEVQSVAAKYLKIRNRITWEREKGRGSETNWKNCSEDILFCTMSERYTFNAETVKIRRRVIAPYTYQDGRPKDWQRTAAGDFRLTHASNFWSDLTVPFWSMPENTDHPTQKPEKLLARIMLASSKPGDMILDPFLGSGTTSVVARKLARHFVGVEIEELYCCLAEKRLQLADADPSIQGYQDGVFWERNALRVQGRDHHVSKRSSAAGFVEQRSLFRSR